MKRSEEKKMERRNMKSKFFSCYYCCFIRYFDMAAVVVVVALCVCLCVCNVNALYAMMNRFPLC